MKTSFDSPLTSQNAHELLATPHLDDLIAPAQKLRDYGFGSTITYSKKVFIPLTQLCRDVCHYCTFAKTPGKLKSLFLSVEEVLDIARQGEALGCKEALFTLGEKPELRYRVARDWLRNEGFDSTIEYVTHVAGEVLQHTSLLPHVNPGNLTSEEILYLRQVAPSMGIMLESSSERLTEKGMPHFGSPDKVPAVRLATLKRLGELHVPTTTGILIGIGETRAERIESLLDIQKVHQEYGHIQEVIVQNFRAKPNTLMADVAEPTIEDLLWTIAVARLIFGPTMSIQAPPNLSPDSLRSIVNAGINDWGGVSPLTPDFVNPEAPWPHLAKLSDATDLAGKDLQERLTIYPRFINEQWVEPKLLTEILRRNDAEGFPRTDDWAPGTVLEPPQDIVQRIRVPKRRTNTSIYETLGNATNRDLSEEEIASLFAARGRDFDTVIEFADDLRKRVNGDIVTYVVNRNINYTNICYFKCQFCAFSKGKLAENLRGRPYDISNEELSRRVIEAWTRGGTEVCLQGGIHPAYTGAKYLEVLQTVKEAVPEIHVHAFSPLEIWQGAKTLDRPLKDFLLDLKEAGLGTLPGTAAEILDDEIRTLICPDKINTEQWLSVMRMAHECGIKSTATIMYGHIEQPIHWARHLVQIRTLQRETGGFTEFVPLPFIHMEAPMYLKGKSRCGPTFREAILMHAVARIALYPHIQNIQASWVKLGREGVRAVLSAGCNDLGGTLMNESISRAAGTLHGQELHPKEMEDLITSLGRIPLQRTTSYGSVSPTIHEKGLKASPLQAIENSTPMRTPQTRVPELVRHNVT
ncbi:MAG: 7,8-didemethyl-8-hydroxy-5-deazariboflavin synthase subunit CofH [Gammaproteobacteria bacterium]|nr:7,8-didemethyl-8-hydroxy-5-deazariboflavin synthase subunit CofH [Gammaproteobacteria bacterium]MYF38919.1 7,8-didemethyl-8-hydroxy-5-deazariboflavin synthase subunit CofH [Gammaproteobacteria bacterium]